MFGYRDKIQLFLKRLKYGYKLQQDIFDILELKGISVISFIIITLLIISYTEVCILHNATCNMHVLYFYWNGYFVVKWYKNNRQVNAQNENCTKNEYTIEE